MEVTSRYSYLSATMGSTFLARRAVHAVIARTLVPDTIREQIGA